MLCVHESTAFAAACSCGPYTTSITVWRLFFFLVARQLTSPRGDHLTPRTGTLYCYAHLFFHIGICFPSSRGSYLVLSGAGHAGRPRLTAVKYLALAEIRGTRSGGIKSRKLARNHGDAFRELRGHPEACNSTCINITSHMFRMPF